MPQFFINISNSPYPYLGKRYFLSRSVPHTGDTRDKDVGEIRGASDISLRAIKEW